MVNLAKLTALVALHLRPLSYKPTPGPQTPTPDAVDNTSRVTGPPLVPRYLLGRRTVPPAHYYSSFAARERKKKKGKAGTTTSASAAAPTGRVAAESSSGGCAIDPYNAPEITNQIFPAYNATEAGVYRYRQQQAVNLGSWFVHEKWMTPSLFTCAADPQMAEIDIAKGWGSLDRARALLERHWDTFITESDFRYLSSIGINTVRLPIGYWNLGPNYTQKTPFESVGPVYVNSWPRIARAINQAGEEGLGVLVDLHGAVGSQNGEHHSGISDGKMGLFENTWYQEKSIEVLEFLVKELAKVSNIVGIQILNEPKFVDGLEDFYTRAIDAIRGVSSTFPIYLHDGFDLNRMSQFVSSHTDFVVQDHHSYFVFSDADRAEKASQHTADIRNSVLQSLHKVANHQRRNLIVGEWSCALAPASMENDGNVTQLRREFCTQQQDVYTDATAGWSFWSYTKEDCESDPGWCFKNAVGAALPSNFSGSTRTTNDTSSSSSTRHQNTWSQSNYDPDPISAGISHRFEAIHNQRVAQAHSQSQGYTDGFNTANVFAQYGSKLGFTGQYIQDTQGGTANADYADDFLKGLRDGEQAAFVRT